VSIELVGLAALMAAVTYPSRALPLLTPGIERLPRSALLYLRLVGPAVLAALAATNALLIVDADRHATLHPGIESVAVLACLAIAWWRRSLFLGLIAAVAITVVARSVGLA
jgi:branched-subunit amino acid transport protein